MTKTYNTKKEVLKQSKIILEKSLRKIIPQKEVKAIEEKINIYDNKRKGLLGDLIEWYVFGKKSDNASQSDFNIAGVELKTTPLKTSTQKIYISKERLVFSMINYNEIIKEKWKNSSFLKKNKTILLMFYLWVQNQSIVDYEFKFTYLLDLLEDISKEDIYQIQKDWEYIVGKIKRGEAHLLSEGDTYYLGACTKAANSDITRNQPIGNIPAKPRAFSFKQQYINYLVQTKLLNKKVKTESIFKKDRRIETIDNFINEKFSEYIGKTDKQILSKLNLTIGNKAKNYKRLIVNRILGVNSNTVEELEKANVTLKVITLEPSGVLKESISFPAFNYKKIINESWYDEKEESMTEFHALLETKKFLFVVFQKQKDSEEIILKKTLFWNFPMKDINEAKRVWEVTIECIKSGDYKKLPKIKDSTVAHVRPHGKNGLDMIETPQGGREIKRCFWLNAKYIQNAINKQIDQA